MLRHFFKITFRNLLKRKSFSIINILGLAIAMAACLLIFFYIQYEFSYEKSWKNSGKIYRINYYRYQNGELSFKSAKALWNMARVVSEDIPGVAGATGVFSDVVSIYTPENQIQDIKMYGTDSSFTDVFKLEFIAKKRDNPLADLHSSVISESAAKRLFGNENPLGKWYKVNQFWEFEVTGIYRDLPQNTHFRFDLLLSVQTYRYYMSNWNDSTNRFESKDPDVYKRKLPVTSWDWGYNGVYTYIRLQDNADPGQVEKRINELTKNYLAKLIGNNGKAEFYLQPIRDIHLKSHFDNEMGINSEMLNIIALALIALVILIIAWINFINLTLARSLERAKETGIRKILGAFRFQITKQYLLEYCIINIISVFIAFILAFAAWSSFGSFLGKSSSISEINNAYMWIILAVLFVTGVLISGFYPALIQSAISSLALFKPKYKTSSAAIDPRKILVIFQFSASVILIIGVLAVFRQLSFMKSSDLGISTEKTLVTYSPMSEVGEPNFLSKINTYKSRLLTLPGIESVNTSSSVPGSNVLLERQDIRKPDDLSNTLKLYSYIYFDHDFIDSYKLTLLHGRNFRNNPGAESKNVLINEAAMKQLGFGTAASATNSFLVIGDKQYQIIGVLKNYHQESLKKEIKPTVYFYGYEWYCSIGYYSIKISSGDVASTINSIETIWKQTYPKDRFEYFFLDDLLKKQYAKERQFGIIFALFTFLAIFISALGLYGLAEFSTLNRTKEIGLRKVNGATSLSIMILLARDFSKWVFFAFIIASPVSYIIMNNWLNNFAYRTNLSWWIFALAGFSASFIALITISMKTWRTATRNPAEALRNE